MRSTNRCTDQHLQATRRAAGSQLTSHISHRVQLTRWHAGIHTAVAEHPTLFEAISDWADAHAPDRGPSRDALYSTLHLACAAAARCNVDIPADRRGEMGGLARDKLMRHFTKKALALPAGERVDVRGTGAALVRLAVRQVWLDFVRAAANEGVVIGRGPGVSDDGTAGEPERGAHEAPDPTIGLDIERVFRQMSPRAVELLKQVDGDGVAIEELVQRELQNDPRRAAPGQELRVRERLDKQVQRARIAFRQVWMEMTGGGAP